MSTGPIPNLYTPDLSVNDLDLNQIVESTSSPEQARGDAARIASGQQLMTEAEAAQIDERIAKQRERIAKVQEKIQSAKRHIERNGSAANFEFDVKARGSLKRAIQRVFGVKTNTITYEMYVEALTAKQTIELTDTDEYVNGNTTKKKA